MSWRLSVVNAVGERPSRARWLVNDALSIRIGAGVSQTSIEVKNFLGIGPSNVTYPTRLKRHERGSNERRMKAPSAWVDVDVVSAPKISRLTPWTGSPVVESRT